MNDDKPPEQDLELNSHFLKVKEKLQVVTELFKEGHLEDAASRLYYAIFHAIAACLRWKKIDLSTHKHAYLLNQFKIHFIDAHIFSKDLFIAINKIKTVRESADYAINQPIDRDNLLHLIEKITNGIKEIKKYLEEQTGTSLENLE